MELQDKRPDILRIAASHLASNVRVFGSAARGEDRPDSDLDLLVEMEPGRSLLDLVGLGQDLEDLFHRVAFGRSARCICTASRSCSPQRPP